MNIARRQPHATRSRRDQIARLRTRIKAINAQDQDMLDLLGVIKGLMDIIADDGDNE